ncbi:hypothetical protein [Nostoc sp.]|uniref:hypothetical protein n=1 Tax=Nostoc sp. TaxID=1180 RepID=UPI002FF9DCB5
MSIDLKIFSTIPDIADWGDIKKRLYVLISSEEKEFLGKNPSLFELASKRKVADDEQLSLGNHYYLSLAIPNTLGLSVISKAEDIDEENLELDYLEDYGENLEPKEVQILLERWRIARYFYIITSFGGRSRPEPRLFIALATAIAFSCSGYIIVTNNDLFDLGVGIYTPEEFQYTKPKF